MSSDDKKPSLPDCILLNAKCRIPPEARARMSIDHLEYKQPPPKLSSLNRLIVKVLDNPSRD
jgi:hypothetical protein